MRNLTACLAAMAALSLNACATDGDVDDDQSVDGQEKDGLDDDFARAARTHGVPADLLKAVSYVETQWQAVEGHEEHEGRPSGVGVFGLWGGNLTAGAAAAGLEVDAVRTDTAANISAGAARLAEIAATLGVSGEDLLAWAPVLAEYAQNPDDDARDGYVDDVLRVLAAGARFTSEDGTLVASIDPHAEITVPETPNVRAATDYGPAIWRSSPNYNSRGGSAVSLIVVHSCEGGYAGCWGWLRNSAAGASAHYVVKENGGEITQLVRESNRAWHVAAAYECSRAGNQQCGKNGVSTNNFSVGIEHAGYASQSSWQSGLIEASAKLSCDIARDHGIPRDRNHIVSHGQLQPWNRTDPGPNWPWSHYIDRIRANCGDSGGGTGSAIIVDSNNANNNQSVAKIELTGTWTSTSGTPGYYGTGYYFANTAPQSAPATFWFYLPSAGTKTIDAWWTAGTNRAAAAPFIAYNAAGTELGRRSVDQRANGSKWVTLGTWNFSAGWNKVALSRWTAEGSVVIADAIRVR
ncbi:MAG: golvesin C-terminal-like domain-containing protein [Kofleriaceae bacterium]